MRIVVLCASEVEARRHWSYDAFGPVVLVTPEHHRLLPPNDFPRGSPIVTTLVLEGNAN
jgi:hypothetical protein